MNRGISIIEDLTLEGIRERPISVPVACIAHWNTAAVRVNLPRNAMDQVPVTVNRVEMTHHAQGDETVNATNEIDVNMWRKCDGLKNPW